MATCSHSTMRHDYSCKWATFYNLEMVVALTFRLNTYEASRIRQKVLESLTQRKIEVFNLLFALKSGGSDNFCYLERNNWQLACNNHHKMIITIIVFQCIDSVLPNKLMPNYRKANYPNTKLPNKFKSNCRKISPHLTEYRIN